MNPKTTKRLNLAAIVLLLVFLLTMSGFFCEQQAKQAKQKSAVLLESLQETIVLKLKSELNFTDDIATAILVDSSDKNFDAAAQELMKHSVCMYIERFKGDTLTRVYPEDSPRQKNVGLPVRSLNRAYSLSKLRKEFIIEGPLTQDGMEVFLTVLPIYRQNEATQVEELIGSVAVALDSQAVINALNLSQITKSGYEYEMWRLNPLDGKKDQISISNQNVDFSRAVETKFELPTIWTLSIIPIGGWFDNKLLLILFAVSFAITIGFAFLLHFYTKMKELKKTSFIFGKIDLETRLMNRSSFLEELHKWAMPPGNNSFVLIYMTVEDYNRYTQICTATQKEELLAHICDCFKQYIKSNYIAARVGEANFVLALKENISKNEIDNIIKGLSIEMIWKYVINGKKDFLSVSCESCRFPEDSNDIGALIDLAAKKLFHAVD